MSIKSDLRKELKQKRKEIKNKKKIDNTICEALICSDMYLNSNTVLFYSALSDEIDVNFAINDALILGKKVALPKCLDNNGNMKFYYINSLDDLKEGFFGVKEPIADESNEVTDFVDSICIVPAIAFDKQGYRLGYGKGYYDRFLKNHYLNSIGLCYNDLVVDNLPIEEYDIPVNYIITENGIITI